MAVEMAASESPTTIIEEGFDLAICSGDLPDSTLVAKIRSDDDRSRRHSQHHTLRCTGIGGRTQPLSSCSFCRAGLCTVGALALDRTRGVLFPQESFGPAILNRCGWVSLNILGLPRRQHGSLPQNSEKVPSSSSDRLERTAPIVAVRPASRRLSAKVRIFIEHLEKTFALCSQFNPWPT